MYSKDLSFLSLVIVLFLSCQQLFAQLPETDVIVEEMMEDISQDEEEDMDLTELTEHLNYYLKNPIDPNKTNDQELGNLSFLSPLQVQALLSHKEANGDFLSLYELQSVSGFDDRSIQRLLPF